MGRNLLSRDKFYRIHEVVITRPLSNFRLLAAKVLALVIVGWIPIAVFIGFINLCAFLQNYIDIDFAESFEIFALVKFLLFTCPVTLSFVAVLSLLFNLVFRNNLLTMAALLGTVIAGSFLITKISLSQYIFFEGLPLVGSIGSALDPESLGFLDFVRYFGYVSVIVFLFFVSVVLYRRQDVFVRRNVIAGSVGGIVLVLCISTTTTFAIEHASKLKHWMDGRELDTVLMTPQVDFANLNAQVVLEPARKLTVKTELKVSVITETVNDVLILWLNPGFSVTDVKVDGVEAGFELDRLGALRVELAERLEQGQEVQLSLSYQGKPDLDYGYFDSSTDVTKIPLWDQLLSYFGYVHGVFSSNFVALPQEVNWLPSPFLPLYEQRVRRDFFDSHIILTLPTTWEAALPGRKVVEVEEILQEQVKIYEFISDTPVSSVGLYAGPLIALGQEINGINFEVLLSEQQQTRHGMISESLDALTGALAEQLDANLTDGFELPCSNYRFIAIPNRLRVYGGGTFLNLLLSDKCTYLLREFDFFAIDWQSAIPPQLDTWGLSRADYFVQIIKNYFRFSFQGTNFELDLYNNYWDYELGIVGPDAEPLSLILAYLNDLVWYASMEGFSASGYFPKAMGRKQNSSQQQFFGYGGVVNVDIAQYRLLQVIKPMIRHIDLIERVVTQNLYTDELQQVALSASIQQTLAADLDPFLVETLRLRCAHLSFQLFQILGKDGAKLLFDELLARYRYSNFRVEDLYATSADLGFPVEELLGNWFAGNEQPNYKFSTAQTYRRKASDDVEEEFQTYFHVMNQGKGTGVFRTSVTTELGGFGTYDVQAGAEFSYVSVDARYGASGTGPVVFLEPGQAVEVGIVSEREPMRVLVQPLNVSVGGGRVAVPTKLIEDTRNIDPNRLVEFHGFRPSTWIPQHIETGIVVDDLDPAFSVENGKHVNDVKTWRRVDYPSAWGSSRRTMVFCESTNPKSIEFQTNLPNAGVWSLEFHLPDLRGLFGDYQQGFLPRGRIGTGGGSLFFWQSIAGDYTFSLDSGDFSKVVEVSINDSDFGWIRITQAHLDNGNAVVSVKPRSTDGKLFGDAIRWVPVDAGE